jgi:hypothetical protein
VSELSLKIQICFGEAVLQSLQQCATSLRQNHHLPLLDLLPPLSTHSSHTTESFPLSHRKFLPKLVGIWANRYIQRWLVQTQQCVNVIDKCIKRLKNSWIFGFYTTNNNFPQIWLEIFIKVFLQWYAKSMFNTEKNLEATYRWISLPS